MKKNAAAPAAPQTRQDEPTIWRVGKPRKKPDRPRHDDRPLFDGLIWMARSGGQWAALPREFGAKSTVNDRYLEWVAYGCFAKAWARLLAVYDDEVGRDWRWQAADRCLVVAPLGKKQWSRLSRVQMG